MERNGFLMGSETFYNGGRVIVFEYILEFVDSSYVKQLIESLGYTNIIKLHNLDPKKTLQDGII